MEKAQINQQAIIDAGFHSLARMDFLINCIWAFRPCPKTAAGPPFFIDGEGRIIEAIHDLCHSQAQTFACLFDQGNRGPTESPRMSNMRMERVKWVKQKCSELRLVELLNKRVRNVLAHYDEYILRELIRDSEGSWIQNLTLSHAAAVEGVDMRRWDNVYVYETDTVHVLGAALNVCALRQEIDDFLGCFI